MAVNKKKFEIKSKVTSLVDKDKKTIDYDSTIIVEVFLNPDGTEKYQAKEKDLGKIPSDTKYTWFTDFSVVGPTKEPKGKRLQEEYTVIVRIPPRTSKSEERTLCYYDAESEKVINITDSYEADSAFRTFQTDLVDPPVGFYP